MVSIIEACLMVHLPSYIFHLPSSIIHLPSYIIHLTCSNMSKIALPTAVSELIDDAKVDKPRNCAKLSA